MFYLFQDSEHNSKKKTVAITFPSDETVFALFEESPFAIHCFDLRLRNEIVDLNFISY